MPPRLWSSPGQSRFFIIGQAISGFPATVLLSQLTAARPGSLKFDSAAPCPNNGLMVRPEAVRRVKSYSAATGYVYQYYFYEVQKTRRGSALGSEYVYMVSVDRKKVFPLRIFVQREGLEKWGHAAGRELTGTEEYAVAKMRLFEALDEVPDLANRQPELVVDRSNIEALLSRLDI
jgi:hypothetical protein